MKHPPLPRTAYPARTTETIRFGDTDMQGHVNNAALSSVLENSRTAVFAQFGESWMGPDSLMVLAEITITYLREIFWPTLIEGHLGVSRIGNSSFTLEQALFEGDTMLVRANCTIVRVDAATRKPAPLDEMRLRILESLRMALSTCGTATNAKTCA